MKIYGLERKANLSGSAKTISFHELEDASDNYHRINSESTQTPCSLIDLS